MRQTRRRRRGIPHIPISQPTPPVDLQSTITKRDPEVMLVSGAPDPDVSREALPGPDPMFTREASAMATLKALGVEQGHAPPTLLHNGLLIANLPRGPYRALRSYEIIELLRVHKEWGRTLSAEEVVTLLGLSEKVR